MTKRDNMRIKSYFTKSVDEGIAQALEELGEDALLLNSRRLEKDSGQPGAYEVVFGIIETSGPTLVPERQAPRKDAVTDLDSLRAELDGLRTLLGQPPTSQRTVGRLIPGLADVHARLLAAEVDPALSDDIAYRIESSLAAETFFRWPGVSPEAMASRVKALQLSPERLETFVQMELELRVPVGSKLGTAGGGGVVVLVGPTGAGKTTSLVKLAASRAFAGGRPVRVLSLDTSGAVSRQKLQSFAGALGVVFTALKSLRMLPALIAEARSKELVLIDTPSYAPGDARAAEVASVLSECPGLDVHLVVPSYMKASDLRGCIARYQIFRPSNLLATKLDETHGFGSVFSEAAQAGMGISFLAYGATIPDDIRPAAGEDLLAMAMDRPSARGRHAA